MATFVNVYYHSFIYVVTPGKVIVFQMGICTPWPPPPSNIHTYVYTKKTIKVNYQHPWKEKVVSGVSYILCFKEFKEFNDI